MKKLLRILTRLFYFVLLGLIVIVTLKTISFSSRQVPITPIQPIEVPDDIFIHLSNAIKIKTISTKDGFDTLNFLRFDSLLMHSFPLVDSFLTKTRINFSPIYKWPGKNTHLKPILLLAHFDIVPIIDQNAWKVDPFSGKIAENFIWGRGTLDDKNSVLAIMEAIEMLLQKNYFPERSVYLAFGQDEEVGGQKGANSIVQFFQKEGIEFEFILDEGALILEDALPMLAPPLAMIGVAEKGHLSLGLSTKVIDGHSMMPPPETAIGILSKAINRLQEQPFPAQISGATKQLFEYAGPEMTPLYRVIFANLWLTEGILIHQLSRESTSNAIIRTTMAPTIIKGGIKDNILPAEARAVINLRIIPGETTETVIERVKATINDKRIDVNSINGTFTNDPSPISNTENFGFKVIQRTIQELFPDVVVAPSLVIAGTDSRHFTPICNDIYRFMPIKISKSDLSRFHGANERISFENYKRMVQFYHQLILNGCK